MSRKVTPIPLRPPDPLPYVVGWAVRWGHEAIIDCPRRGRFVERIRHGSFASAIEAGAVELWVNHDRHRGCAARQRDGGLVLVEDGVGLWFEATLDSVVGDDALQSVRGAGYRGCSVGMTDVVADWLDEDGQRIRDIRQAGLREISLCRRGAYPTSIISAGSLRTRLLREERRAARLAAAEATLAR